MRVAILAVSAVALVATPAWGQTSFPMVTHVHPVAVQRGQTTEVVIEGQQNFFGVYQVLFERGGLTAQIVGQDAAPPAGKPKPQVRNVKLKLTVAADAPVGVHEFRVASSLGISSVGQLVVVDEPVVQEKQANNTFPQAQEITLPCVVAGKIEAVEDVDFFKFEATAGQTVSFELTCARLQDRIHDLQKHAKPMLTLFDSEGRELAANDTFYFADPMLSFTIQRTGTHFIQVRDSTYDGDQRWVYALRATNRPYASHVYPMAGNPGQKLEVEPIGSAGKGGKVVVQVPTEPGVHLVQLDVAGVKTNPVTLISSSLPQVMEQEPNDEPGQATRFTIPAGINGKIGKKRDMDHYVFAAKKGRAVRFEVRARRFGTLLNSSIHAVLDLLDAKGTLIASSDDSHGKEPVLVFTPPLDADYILRVRDLNSKGGDSFVYFVEADHSRPDFTLRCDPDKAMIGPGSSAAWYVHVVRSGGFTGPVQIDVKDLPPEVSASPLTIPPSMTQGLIVLTASPSATQAARYVRIIGTARVKQPDGKEETLVRGVTPIQEIYNPGGGRATFNVGTQVVAVTDPSDILKVNVNVKEIVLKPGQEAKIDVDIVPRPDYDKGVSLDITLNHLGSIFGNPLPPGVTIEQGKCKTLLGTGNKGHFVIKAAANAEPIENVPISTLAHVSINFVVKVSYSSPVILVSVRK